MAAELGKALFLDKYILLAILLFFQLDVIDFCPRLLHNASLFTLVGNDSPVTFCRLFSKTQLFLQQFWNSLQCDVLYK